MPPKPTRSMLSHPTTQLEMLPDPARTERRIAAAVLFLSGASALAHESLWTRRLIDLLGATGEASARALGGLFLGLALGAAVAGTWTSRVKRPWRAAGFAELCVGLFSLPMLTLGSWSEPLWPWLGVAGVAGQQGSWLKLIVSMLLLVPPAAAMGAVLPWVLAAVNSRAEGSTNSALGMYTVNALGGIAGLMSIAFVLIPSLGAWASMLIAIGGNVIAGMALLIVDRRTHAAPPPGSVATFAAPNASLPPMVISFVSGFGLLAIEVLALQSLMLVAPLAYHSPAVFLMVVLAALALGSWCTPWMLTKGTPLSWLVRLLPWTAVAIAIIPWQFMSLASTLSFGPEAFFALFVSKTLFFCLFAFGPALLLCGLVFPLAAAASSGNEEHPIPWGRLLAVNGLGGWIGAEFAMNVLMPTFGPYRGLGVVALVMATLGLAIAAMIPQDTRRHILAAIGAIGLITGLLFGYLGRIPVINPHLGFRIVDQRLNREGAVSVVEHESFGRAFLVSNQYILGSTRATPDQRRQGLLPLVLHPAPRSVAFIGVATGITPGAALDVSGVEKITAMELSHSIADMAREYFAEENGRLLDDPRTSLVIEDGRTLVAAARGEYDVLIGDLILPWSPGEGRLYTREHFESARRSLKPRGLYCQWVPLYQLTKAQFAMVIRTFQSVFPRAELIRREFSYRSPAVALIGWQDDGLIDWKVVEKRCQRVYQENLIRDPTVRHHESVAMFYLGSAAHLGGIGPLNTLDCPAIEFDAGRERVTGDPGSKYLSGGRWIKLMVEMIQSLDAARTETSFARLGAQWTEYEALSQLEATRRGTNLRRLPSITLPLPLVRDNNADWNTWPGSRDVLNRTFTAMGIPVPQ